eukprot:SM000026S08876  [mRNA]  locus=s26:264864:265576:- [translate_table: standard]
MNASYGYPAQGYGQGYPPKYPPAGALTCSLNLLSGLQAIRSRAPNITRRDHMVRNLHTVHGPRGMAASCQAAWQPSVAAALWMIAAATQLSFAE